MRAGLRRSEASLRELGKRRTGVIPGNAGKRNLQGWKRACLPLSGFAGGGGKAVTLGIDLLAQIAPDIFRHGEKDVNHLGIKLAAGPALNFLASGRQRLSGAVGTVGSDRVKRIGDRENACA